MSFPFHVAEHILDAQYIRDSPRATASPHSQLKLCIKQYTPLDNPNPQPGDVTIVATHGTGFPKELYEPLWEELLARATQDGYRIRAIWIADAVNQGASGILNEQQLGNETSWFDHSRDVIHMLNHFRAEMPHPIVGVGHSLGAAQLIFASLFHPRLFTSLLLLEPFLNDDPVSPTGAALLTTASVRRDIWPSRAAAAHHSRKALHAWDARVVARWLAVAYRDLPTALYAAPSSAVTLATTKHQETAMYTHVHARPQNPVVLPGESLSPALRRALPARQLNRAEPILMFKLVPHLPVPALYVSGSRSPLYRDGAHADAARRTGTAYGGSGGVACGMVRHDVIEGAGHAAPLEKVAATAGAMGSWIGLVVRVWRDEEVRLAEWRGLVKNLASVKRLSKI